LFKAISSNISPTKNLLFHAQLQKIFFKITERNCKKIFWNQHLFNFEQHFLPTKSMTFLKNLTELRLLLSIIVHFVTFNNCFFCDIAIFVVREAVAVR